MIFKPHPLSTSQLPAPELEEDRKSCRKVGPWDRKESNLPEQLLCRQVLLYSFYGGPTRL